MFTPFGFPTSQQPPAQQQLILPGTSSSAAFPTFNAGPRLFIPSVPSIAAPPRSFIGGSQAGQFAAAQPSSVPATLPASFKGFAAAQQPQQQPQHQHPLQAGMVSAAGAPVSQFMRPASAEGVFAPAPAAAGVPFMAPRPRPRPQGQGLLRGAGAGGGSMLSPQKRAVLAQHGQGLGLGRPPSMVARGPPRAAMQQQRQQQPQLAPRGLDFNAVAGGDGMDSGDTSMDDEPQRPIATSAPTYNTTTTIQPAPSMVFAPRPPAAAGGAPVRRPSGFIGATAGAAPSGGAAAPAAQGKYQICITSD
jgi:hypothetical protein